MDTVAPEIWPERRRARISATQVSAWGFSAVVVAFVVAMTGIVAWQSAPVWLHEGGSYLTGTRWLYRSKEFGAAPMIYGTVATSLIALFLAAPVGILAAVFIAEYAGPRLRLTLKVLAELLAGIPSVVYGLLGILVLRDWIYQVLERFDPVSGDSILTAGVLLAVMILPTIVTLTDDALRAVSGKQRLAARGLGLTKAESVLKVALRQAGRGIFAAVLLALGRALGETIAVFLVVGRQDNVWNPGAWRTLIEPGQTLTSKLGGAETNIAFGDSLHWAAMLGLGLVLLTLCGTITLIGSALFNREEDHAPAR